MSSLVTGSRRHGLDQRLEMGLLLGRPAHPVHPVPLVEPLDHRLAVAQLLEPLLFLDHHAGLGVVRLELRLALGGNERELPAEHTPLGLGLSRGVGQLLANAPLAGREPGPPAVILGVVTSTHSCLLTDRRPANPVPHPLKAGGVSSHGQLSDTDSAAYPASVIGKLASSTAW